MSSQNPLRETLFGDVPLERWAGDRAGEPWQSFGRAADQIAAGDPTGARDALQSIIATTGLESRHYLEAWHGLRSIGVTPDGGQGKHVYGVVLDVPMEDSWDTLAAYDDHSCRYLNYSGRATIWDHPTTQLDHLIDRLLAAGQVTANLIGPWQEARPPLTEGHARVSFLCPSGLHFGQARMATLLKDPKASAVFEAGGALLEAIVDLTTSRG